MGASDDKSIMAVIVKMQRKRDHLQKELEKVQEWLGQVYAFINQGKAIIGDEPKNVVVGKPESPAVGLGLVKTNAEKIKKLFETSGKMTIPAINDAFLSRNWPINSKSRKNRLQVLKNTLLSKPDWFVKDETAKTWGLKEREEISSQ